MDPSCCSDKFAVSAPLERLDCAALDAHTYTLASCNLRSQDGLDSPARAMFESRDGHEDDGQLASPQYLLPMEYTHADAEAEVYTCMEYTSMGSVSHRILQNQQCQRHCLNPEVTIDQAIAPFAGNFPRASCSASWCAGGGSPPS